MIDFVLNYFYCRYNSASRQQDGIFCRADDDDDVGMKFCWLFLSVSSSMYYVVGLWYVEYKIIHCTYSLESSIFYIVLSHSLFSLFDRDTTILQYFWRLVLVYYLPSIFLLFIWG